MLPSRMLAALRQAWAGWQGCCRTGALWPKGDYIRQVLFIGRRDNGAGLNGIDDDE